MGRTALGPGAAGSRPAAEGHAGVTRGLGEVLDRVRSALGADTATVLSLDDTRSFLEPLATVGLDRTLHRARRVPMGEGFAGRVAQSRQPVVLSRVDASTVLNPVLLDHGLQTLLGVPVIDGSELLGVLHVGYLRQHLTGDDELGLLSRFATELGALLHDRFVDEAHSAALALQRSLLPTTVATPEGVSIAARYVPADGDLGGDWYDVFPLPGGRLVVVLGDVVGHGLEAAIRMGRLRSALRAYALDHDDPAEVLRRLDRLLCHFEPEVFATVALGIADAPFTQWRFSSAGHFPPLVGGPDRSVAAADVPPDPLLGFRPDTSRRSTTVDLPAGGFLCLYTDGLVERRPTPHRTVVDALAENTTRLVAALEPSGDAEMRCMRVLTDVVGDEVIEDDVAIVVVQTDPV